MKHQGQKSTSEKKKREPVSSTFSSYHEHSSPLFKDLNVVKFSDIITRQLAVFMYKFHNNLLLPLKIFKKNLKLILLEKY